MKSFGLNSNPFIYLKNVTNLKRSTKVYIFSNSDDFSIDYILGKVDKNIDQKTEIIKCIIEKSTTNPIIAPITQNIWESCGTFNPTIVNIDGNIYILYNKSRI